MKRQPITLKLSISLILVLFIFPFLFIQCQSKIPPSEQAKIILDKSGIKGGLIVHLNCGDGILTEALKAGDGFLVQGLDKSEENVRKARQYIQSKQKYGPVSVDRLMGNYLPYKDNLVNMIVAEDLGDISELEAMRVLTPDGILMTGGSSGWNKVIKTKSDKLDEWNQFLYNASGNPVSNDEAIEPIKNYQWIGSPRWGRHHDTTASMSALVSSNGRIFYILDEGPTESIQLPAENYLVARDAYNGTILWKKPVTKWVDHLFSLKSGPSYIPRRLVAVDDSVYVTMDINGPLTELDAATGEIIRTFKNSDETSEIVLLDNMLYIVVGRPEKTKETYTPKKTYVWENADLARSDYAWGKEPAKIMAVNRTTGDTAWNFESPVAPLTLTADSGLVYFYDGIKLVGLDQKSGKQIWQSEDIVTKKIDTSYSPRIVVSENVLLFSAGSRGFGQPGRLIALSTTDGKKMWEAPQPGSGHYSIEDLFVIDGLVWVGRTANVQDDGTYYGRNIHTGELVKEIPGYKAKYWFHQRCYPSKATNNFIIPSRTGIEFVDLKNESWDINHYVRGGCFYGIMPSNGLIYAPPHACACYMEAKLSGFCAMGGISNTGPDPKASSQNRLEKGPAYNREIVENAGKEDWPTYRHDTKRSSFTKTIVAPEVNARWNVKLGGKLSSPVVAGNKMYVSRIDAHTVYSIDTKNGDIIWSYTAGARVDSPPTIYKGRVLFGSTDGFVYCLDAADGALVWRFRAAPRDMRMAAFEQVESVWPVHGSVLVENNKIYCVAGRSMFLDGGMRMLMLDPVTGDKLSEIVLDEKDPETDQNLHEYIQSLNMPVALNDVLSSDGNYIYMRSQQFDFEGNRKHIGVRNVNDQTGEGAHVFSPVGFLDDSQFSRSYMMFGKSVTSGWGSWEIMGRLTPSGRLLAVDDENVYGYARKPEFLSESIVLEYQLYAADKFSKKEDIERVNQSSFAAPKPKPKTSTAAARPVAKPAPKPKPKAGGMMMSMPKSFIATGDWKLRQGMPKSDQSALSYKWQLDKPGVQARAIVVADKTLFIAGPPDIVDEEDAFFAMNDEEILGKLRMQSDLLKGKDGGRLWAVSTQTGEKLAEHKLDSLPVWDGMIAANNKLFMTTINGDIACFGEAN